MLTGLVPASDVVEGFRAWPLYMGDMALEPAEGDDGGGTLEAFENEVVLEFRRW
jgi:hypothetical protein